MITCASQPRPLSFWKECCSSRRCVDHWQWLTEVGEVAAASVAAIGVGVEAVAAPAPADQAVVAPTTLPDKAVEAPSVGEEAFVEATAVGFEAVIVVGSVVAIEGVVEWEAVGVASRPHRSMRGSPIPQTWLPVFLSLHDGQTLTLFQTTYWCPGPGSPG